MYTKLLRASELNVPDYIRIAQLNVSPMNTIATDYEEVLQEIKKSMVYMIQFKGKLIGFISYIIKDANQAYVSEVQIEPDFRGRGIGGYALSVILEMLKGIEIIYLWTHPDNPAQNLYRRHGFRENGEIIENDNNTGQPRMKMVLERK